MQSPVHEKRQNSVVVALCLLCILLLSNISILLTLIRQEMKDGNGSVNQFRQGFCMQNNATAMDVSFIEGGQVAEKNQLPWNVALQSGTSFCSGSLINSLWVLSAAHCQRNYFILFMGQVNLEGPGILYRRSIKTIPHGKYEDSNFDLKKNPKKDIMLIKLDAPVMYNDNVQPIRLPEKEYQFMESDLCIMSGWGTDRKNFGTASKDLKYACARPESNDVCTAIYDIKLTNDEICFDAAVRENPHQAACAGDSGGPVSCWVDDQWQLAGIMSWGGICNTSRRTTGPGVGINVAAFRDWIDFIVTHY